MRACSLAAARTVARALLGLHGFAIVRPRTCLALIQGTACTCKVLALHRPLLLQLARLMPRAQTCNRSWFCGRETTVLRDEGCWRCNSSRSVGPFTCSSRGRSCRNWSVAHARKTTWRCNCARQQAKATAAALLHLKAPLLTLRASRASMPSLPISARSALTSAGRRCACSVARPARSWHASERRTEPRRMPSHGQGWTSCRGGCSSSIRAQSYTFHLAKNPASILWTKCSWQAIS
mmetsp:Transcript_57214/g.124311  ORF Transcript_57214/g.124311 Transcript_57214/m.124311 type:complete len:236 (-) Transcript_57214:236-943(-)